MLLTFARDGTTVFEVETDAAPQTGDKVVFRMAVDLDGLEKGALVSAIVSADHRPKYDFDTLAPRVWLGLTILTPKPMFE
ncbi:hypothetical protein QP166_18465 [Sphingomonas sp. LR60]|uniref:hypothetical protein n=1 Tax=Sphingomonas sp. LR60 TaxID=3050233 RepID=UPI002FE0B581